MSRKTPVGTELVPTGAVTLDAVESFIRRYCVLPNEHSYAAVTLWAAHTHLIDKFETTPRLASLSPEPGSGKTRVLEVLQWVCRNATEVMLRPSEAVVFRLIDAEKPTLLLDEVDAIFGTKQAAEANEGLRGVLNSGYRAGAVVPRCGGSHGNITIERFAVFSAVAMAGLGSLPDTLLSRSIIIRMKRRARSEKVEAYRERLIKPDGEKLREQLATWAELTELTYPTLPDGVEDRDADCWEPLIAVADAARGDWPRRAREACLKFIAEKPINAVSLGVRLLSDVQNVWPDGAEVMSTLDMLGKLSALDEAPWADLYGEGLKPRKLSTLLSEYEIRPMAVWIDGRTHKGYRRESFWDAWQRYCPSVLPEKGKEGKAGKDGKETGSTSGDSLTELTALTDLTDSRKSSLGNSPARPCSQCQGFGHINGCRACGSDGAA